MIMLGMHPDPRSKSTPRLRRAQSKWRRRSRSRLPRSRRKKNPDELLASNVVSAQLVLYVFAESIECPCLCKGASSRSGTCRHNAYDRSQEKTNRSLCAGVCPRTMVQWYESEGGNGGFAPRAQRKQGSGIGSCKDLCCVLGFLHNIPLVEEKFLSELLLIVKKVKKFVVKKDQGWYSDAEMKTDLGWSVPGSHMYVYVYVCVCKNGPLCFRGAIC